MYDLHIHSQVILLSEGIIHIVIIIFKMVFKFAAGCVVLFKNTVVSKTDVKKC